MRLLTNSGVAIGRDYAHNNERAANATLYVWGTPTDVDLEISPDNGSTWFVLQNVTAVGSFSVPVGGSEGYQIRGQVNVGSGVYMDLIF